MFFKPHFWTTVLGSFPHQDDHNLSKGLLSILDVPCWPQLPRRTFRENMYVQFSASLPAIVIDEEEEVIFIDTSDDFSISLEAFYERYLANEEKSFSLSPMNAAGFFGMLKALEEEPAWLNIAQESASSWIKGQVTGPISLGLTITDQNHRASIYNEWMSEALVMNAIMNARWQVRELKSVRPNVILFVDEPYMASIGSAYISLSSHQVIAMLEEVFAAIHEENALAGVHCCANTDWSVLLGTHVDILHLDAFGYLENLALYPTELKAFLDRDGVLAWGIVPNNEAIWNVTAEGLANKLREGFALIGKKGKGRGIQIHPGDFTKRSLISPSCGLGSATVEIAERVLEVLQRTGEILKQG